MAEFEVWWWCGPVLPWVAWGEFWTLCGLLAAWGWSTGAAQVAAPLGEVLRSAGSRRGRSEWQNSRFGGGGGVGYLGLPGGSFGPHLGSKRQGKWQNRLQPLYGGSLGVLGAGCCGLNRRFWCLWGVLEVDDLGQAKHLEKFQRKSRVSKQTIVWFSA